ncbi:MAG: hypothetical protein M3P18_20970, partial [Actinomycetota bacterium]|nr:hypothetical protein [Actinomycetota bacterium]
GRDLAAGYLGAYPPAPPLYVDTTNFGLVQLSLGDGSVGQIGESYWTSGSIGPEDGTTYPCHA